MKKISFARKKLFNTYNNDFKKIDLIVTGIMFGVAIIMMCYLHGLNVYYSFIVMGTGIICLPIIFSSYFKYQYEKRHFEEYCIYFENMRMFFKVYKKVVTALEETLKMLKPKSQMAKLIEKAIDEINNTGDYEKALGFIGQKYHNTYLDRLHSLLVTGEIQGGESVYLNLDNINYQEWKEAMNLFQKKKKKTRYLFYLMAVISLGISLYGVYVINIDGLQLSLFKNATYQLYTFIELELLLILFIYVYCTLVNKRWIRGDE